MKRAQKAQSKDVVTIFLAQVDDEKVVKTMTIISRISE